MSDPGRHLLNVCIEKDIQVIPIPGVSSIISAMSVSGFDDKFLFLRFPSKTQNDLEKILSSLSNYKFSQIFFIPAKKFNFYIEKFKNIIQAEKL